MQVLIWVVGLATTTYFALELTGLLARAARAGRRPAHGDLTPSIPAITIDVEPLSGPRVDRYS